MHGIIKVSKMTRRKKALIWLCLIIGYLVF
uniref:Uncharacterized protein n=1 Tax=Podoviridae sp. ctdKF3 TaxID=2825261 RepID=A0A8S5PS46_9CAUD|nr:MAG TPA: hypothetical protein [Podoviridae sp. ctdKF3]